MRIPLTARSIAWIVSVGGHLLLGVLLLFEGFAVPQKPVVITAQLILPSALEKGVKPARAPQKVTEKPKQPPVEKPPQAIPDSNEVDKLAAAKAEALELERKANQSQESKEKKAKAQEVAKEKAKKLAEAQEKSRLEAEKKAKAQAQAKAEKEKKEAEVKKQETRKKAEAKRITEALAQEERARAQSQVLEQYQSNLIEQVYSKWEPPVDLGPRTVAGDSAYQCVAKIQQNQQGEILEIDVAKCQKQYGTLVSQSVRRALIEASPLPLPSDSALFASELIIVFAPEN